MKRGVDGIRGEGGTKVPAVPMSKEYLVYMDLW